MTRNTRYLVPILLAGSIFTSCKKDSGSSTTTPVSAQTVTNINADPTSTSNHYAFYSLERNETVAVTDSATNKWDIAFRSTTIITNSGTSGPGLGGAFVQTGTTYDDYAKVAADSTFRVDNMAATPAFAIPTGSGNGWYNYNASTNIITPIPGRLIIVRTATGKYAKLEITSYYKDAPATPDAGSTSRYYHFRFGFQADGSKNFK
jgi:hypothetical protein